MSVQRFGAAIALVVCCTLASCDSTTPASAGSGITGMVTEAGSVPAPSLAVDITIWTATGPGSGMSRWVETDQTGGYDADFESLAPIDLDSVRIGASRFDCGGQQTASVTVSTAQLPDVEMIEAPTLDMSYRLPLAQFGTGRSFCAAAIDLDAVAGVGDLARLAIWIDDMSDSVRGRWRLNHSISSGDDYGYFSGSEVATSDTHSLQLHLRPTQPTSCTGLDLVIPTTSPNTSFIDVSTVTSDGSCALPNGPLRFFDGAILAELQSPQ